jgi:hypothetical protein
MEGALDEREMVAQLGRLVFLPIRRGREVEGVGEGAAEGVPTGAF